MERRRGVIYPSSYPEEKRAPGYDHTCMWSHPPPMHRGGGRGTRLGRGGGVPREAPLARCLREAHFEAGERGKHRNQPKKEGPAGAAHNFLVTGGGGDEGG